MPTGIYKRAGTGNGFQKGHKAYKFWLGKKLSKEIRQKMQKAQSRRKERDGYMISPKAREKMSKTRKGKPMPWQCGEKSRFWKGGISFEPYSINWTDTLRRSIRERDHYACQKCGILQGDTVFDVHHIDSDKKNCNPNNLITLCRKCHNKVTFYKD